MALLGHLLHECTWCIMHFQWALGIHTGHCVLPLHTHPDCPPLQALAGYHRVGLQVGHRLLWLEALCLLLHWLWGALPEEGLDLECQCGNCSWLVCGQEGCLEGSLAFALVLTEVGASGFTCVICMVTMLLTDGAVLLMLGEGGCDGRRGQKESRGCDWN